MIKNLYFKSHGLMANPLTPHILRSSIYGSTMARPQQPANPMNPCMNQYTYSPYRPFSQYFRDLDKASLQEFGLSFCGSKQYTKAFNLWKVPLEKKRLKRERKAANPPHIEPPESSG